MNYSCRYCLDNAYFEGFHGVLPSPPIIHCDNQPAIALSSNPIQHFRIKNLEIDYHFVRNRVQKWDIEVQCIPAEDYLKSSTRIKRKILHKTRAGQQALKFLDFDFI